jgi:hypothetical protein
MSAASTTMVPFPCVVYTRSIANTPYVYSHACSQSIKKTVPASLRVQDLKLQGHAHNWETMRRACFLVLVAGDTAQCISVANHLERRTPFLYQGSKYSRASEERSTAMFPSEFQAGHVPMHFYSTLSFFDGRGRLGVTAAVECGITLLPNTLLERDLTNITRWVENNLLKSMRTSVWFTDRGASYCELTRSIRNRHHSEQRDTKEGG